MTPPRPAPRLLVIDDEPDLRTLYELTLLRAGHQIDTASDLHSGRELLQQHRYDLVITDMRLPDGLGLELVRELQATRRSERCMVITAYGSAENAVEALKAGAFDYLTKPVDLKQLRHSVSTALQTHTCAPVASNPPRTAPSALEAIVGQTPGIQTVKQRIERVAGSMAPVLILGESGTGKELVARALHACSHRCAGPFVAVNCGAIPENLLEAEFFGVRKGAYTGATHDRPGYFHAAEGGTLFLDEIGDLPLPMQAKLLRAIQERSVRPLGSTQEETTDVRIVSATHRDLAHAVQSEKFRQDLYYRLNVIELNLPPLRERLDDLPAITQQLLAQLAQRHGLPTPPRLSPQALTRLAQHPFPGNVRELENILERAVALFPEAELCAEAMLLPAATGTPPTPSPAIPATGPADDPDAPLPREALLARLQNNRWNQSRTARELGWTLAKLRYWMQRMGLGDASST